MFSLTRLKESYNPVTEDKQCQHIPSPTCTKNSTELSEKNSNFEAVLKTQGYF